MAANESFSRSVFYQKVLVQDALFSEDVKPSTTYFWIRWTSDGRAVSYIDDYGGLSNIWSQPLDGGPLKQLTHFESDRMFNFQWLPDGTLVCARGTVTSDVVLISNFK